MMSHRNRSRAAASLLLGLTALTGGGGAPFALAAEAAAPTDGVTILYDAFGKQPGMQQDWGFAALIEINGKRILFDTGNNGDILANNLKARGIDPTSLDFVVMSHRHGDHMGGLSYLLSVNPKVRIYAPKENFGVYGSALPSAFYRKSESLPTQMRYYDGTPPETMQFGTAWPGADFRLVDKTVELAPGMTLIALVSDAPGTKELKELSLAIDTPDGLILVVGCSHPGIEAIVAEAAKIDPHIRLIVGGLHLVAAPDAAIAKTVAALHDAFKVDYIAPGHCTGEPTFLALREAFGDRYLYAGLGTHLGLDKSPLAEASGSASPRSDRAALQTPPRLEY